MFTVRISPKISANPLATMNSAAANVIESRKIFRKDEGSWTAEPKFVVRQLVCPRSPETVVRKRTYTSANATRPNASRTGRRRQVRYDKTWSREGILAASALNSLRR